MGSHDDSITSITLLERLKAEPADQAAWSEFVDRYGPKVFAWCRGWGLQAVDAEDVTQAVLTKLAIRMERFTYDPSQSFRGWLRRLARNAWSDWLASLDRPGVVVGGAAGDLLLQSVAAREDLVRRLEAQFDLEVLAEAMARTRGRVNPRTWDAYWLATQEGLPTGDVAERLGLNVAGVFKAKSNVLKMIRQEVDALSADPDEGALAP